ncbi:MAG TPA: LysR family transcriptional regulator [Kofleriaceae bacterium]|nr:LysR family transcriptional regulator [Kofleriaceae bacterium]
MLTALRRNLWNWLPTFAEVAETGSVVAAARRLALTPAAVSRTLRLLEDALGTPVFNRVGRGLVLNAAGAALRDAVRAATRDIDAGLSESLGDPFLGPLRVSSLGVLTDHFVVPALVELKGQHPDLVPEHAVLGPAEAATLLVRGLLDVAFWYEEVTAEEIVVERLGAIGASIYCGRGHPLFSARKPSLADVLAHPFSVPRIGDTGRVQDGWPSDIPRKIGMRITMLRSNLQVALSGKLVTVLPDVTAAPHEAAGELRRLPVLALAPIEIFAARHSAALGRRPGQLAIDAVVALLAPNRHTASNRHTTTNSRKSSRRS